MLRELPTAGTGLQPVPFVLKFHFVLFIWETSETGCKPVPAITHNKSIILCFFIALMSFLWYFVGS